MHVMPANSVYHVEDLNAINKINVFAAGKAESAFVWWVMDKPVESEEISGWEVYRYRHYPRLDKTDEWVFKGKMYVDGSHCRNCLVPDLHDSCMYRFSVRCLYANVPPLAESAPSARCLIDKPLPAGWLRIFDTRKGTFYYANVRSRESCWDRPEANPFYLEESVTVYFTPSELHFLKNLYGMELKRYGCISVLGFRESLIQVGESQITDDQLKILFKNFSRKKEENKKPIEINSWMHYMDIMRCLKKKRMKCSKGVTKYFNSLFVDQDESKKESKDIPITDRRRKNVRRSEKYGDWVEARDPIENIPFYTNEITNAVSWDIPLDVRTYLSPESEAKFLPYLDTGDLETLRQYFDCLDRTQTGSLSMKDLNPVAEALVLKFGNSARGLFTWIGCKSLSKKCADFVQFEEFCYMICCLVSRGSTCRCLLWRNIDYNYDYGGCNGKRKNSNSKDIPISLLNAIGISILKSYDDWLTKLQRGGEIEKKKVLLLSSILWTEARVVNKVLPVTEGSSREIMTERRTLLSTDSHNFSCFCGCRGMKIITTNSTTRL